MNYATFTQQLLGTEAIKAATYLLTFPIVFVLVMRTIILSAAAGDFDSVDEFYIRAIVDFGRLAGGVAGIGVP